MPKNLETEDNIEDFDLDELEDELEDEDLFDDDDDDLEDEDDLEESVGSETLKPMGGSGGGETKAETLATFTALLSQLGKDDLTSLFNKTQEQFGPNKFPGNKDSESTNKNTIKAKPSDAKGSGDMGSMPMPKLGVKEDVEEMLGTDETLSEEFKERAEVVFEAALNTRLNIEKARIAEENEEYLASLNEAYEEALEENVQNILEDLTDKLDQYLNYCVEEWMEENQIAIETSLRTDIAESFMDSLRGVFAEHYIDIPEERFDVVNDLKEQLDTLKEQHASLLDEKLELENLVNNSLVESILEDVSSDLTATQTEKLRTLSEGLEFTDPSTYAKKLAIVKENYFGNKTSDSHTGLITEEIDGEDTTGEGNTRPDMSKYVKAISKSKI